MVTYKYEPLTALKKLRRVEDYIEVSLLALQREQSVHDEPVDQGANDLPRSPLSDD
jgi:hypothetical protein